MPKATVNDQLRLAGRMAIVTGAGRGIGRAIAELYGREGARVVIASRSADGCSAAVEAIEAAGGTAIAKPTDMGIKSDVVEMVGFAVETYGSLDILVNNAQSWGTRDHPTGLPVPTPLESFDDAELDWTFDTGFRGTFWAMQAAFPHMRERGGRIINFASMYGVIGNAGTVGYNITEEGVRALTRTAAGSGLATRSPPTSSRRRRRPTPLTKSSAPIPRVCPQPSPPYRWGASATRAWISHRPCCSSPPTTPATSPARPSAWTEGRFCTPDQTSTDSNVRITATTANERKDRVP